MAPPTLCRPALALLALIACGDSAARVELRRLGGACGAVADARTLIVRALTDDGEVTRSVSVGAVAELADLPPSTRQLALEVLGAGGALRAVGKSAPLTFGELRDGEAIAIAMAPPGGLCPTAPMLEPRTAPIVARAGRYVLVLGGSNAGGALASAELYDPQEDRFESVPLPARLVAAGSFVGAAATELPDGRVALTGGPTGSYTVFDPQTKRFGPPIVLEPRFFHGAAAVGGDEILVAGGCRGASNEVCSGAAARPTFQLAVDSDAQEFLTALDRDHVAPTVLFDPGLAAGLVPGSAGRGAAALIVGASTAQGLPMQTADRLELASGAVTAIAGSQAAAAMLDSGAVLTGFAPGGLAPDGAASVISLSLAARAVADGPKLRGATLTLLEDGSALALGEGEGGAPAAALYRPAQNRWQALTLPAELGALGRHRAVRLVDGSVLIVGAGTAQAPAATAWRLRPSLVGPFSSSVISVPSQDGAAELTASDPAAVERELATGRYELRGVRDGLGAWVVVGGPRLVDGSISAVLRPTLPGTEDGVALVTHFESAASLVVTRVVPGQPITVQRHLGAQTSELCRGGPAPALPATTTVALVVRAGALVVRVGEATVLSCAVGELTRGAWGVGALGATSRLGIDTLTVER